MARRTQRISGRHGCAPVIHGWNSASVINRLESRTHQRPAEDLACFLLYTKTHDPSRMRWGDGPGVKPDLSPCFLLFAPLVFALLSDLSFRCILVGAAPLMCG
jgi:hypothetical protein